MRPVKRRLMELNIEGKEGEEEMYQRAVMEIGDHISSCLTQWSCLEERSQWKKLVNTLSLHLNSLTHTHTHYNDV